MPLHQQGLYGRRTNGVVKSVQRGTISISGTSTTATIAYVDVNNSIIRYLGSNTSDAGTTVNIGKCRVELTNATTVTAFVGASGTNIASYEVVEFWPGVIRSIQRSTFNLTSTSNTLTVSGVDTTRATLEYLGHTNTAAATANNQAYSDMTLTNATTITFAQNTAGNATIGYQLVEWY